MKRIIHSLVSMMLFASFSLTTQAQITHELNSNQSTTTQTTQLKAFQKRSWNQFKDVPQLRFAAPNVQALLEEDALRDKNGQAYRFGTGIDVNITTENSGIWTVNEKGDRIWRLKIQQPGALAQSFIFSKFQLYGDATIDVYNVQGQRVHLTYSAKDVLETGGQNLSLCEGDLVMIELIEPKGTQASVLEMEQVMYAYRSYGGLGYTEKINESDPCQVNVNCSEGAQWQDEKKGVARILMVNGYSQSLCTGSLINNTAQDCKPYFLTAMHCGDGVTNFSNWRFYFNYEASGCSNPTSSGQVPQTYITGAQKIAGSEDVSGNNISKSDFLLIKLGSSSNESATINQLKTWGAYWNGWDANNTAAPSGAGIHHPSGDIKKISTFTQPLTSANYSGPTQNTHWRVYWAQTANGHGVTEGGSSGSPIFTYNNGNSRIVGKLSGGTSYCSNTSGHDLYGKISYSWTSAGTTNARRLKPWLDPSNTGAMVLDGSYDPCSGGGTNPDPDPDPDPGNGACVPEVGDCDEYIAKVTLGAINNSTGCDGYIDYPNLSAALTVGQQYQVGVTPGILSEGVGSYYTNDVVGVWIDWNGDGQFNGPNETIGTTALSQNYAGGFTFTVPSSVAAGTYIMRVKIDYDQSSQGTIAPCGGFNAPYYSGEVEDYRVVVSGGGSNPGGTSPYDIQVVLNSPTSGATLPPNAAQTVSFTLKNNGPGVVPAGDTLWLGYLHRDNSTQLETLYRLSDGVLNNVNGMIMPQEFAVGQSISSAQLGAIVGSPVTINTSSFVNGDRVYVWCLGSAENPNTLLGGDDNDANNNNNRDFFKIGQNSSLTELDLNEVVMYPNPSSNLVTIDFSSNYQSLNVVVYDLTGQIVRTVQDKNGSSISVSIHDLAAGIYQVAIQTEMGQVVRKLIKK